MTEEVPRKRRRWRRAIGWTALVAVALPVLILVAALLSLRAEGVRDRILARVSAILLEEYGLALTVEDFTPSWRSSRVERVRDRADATELQFPWAMPPVWPSSAAHGKDYIHSESRSLREPCVRGNESSPKPAGQ